MYVHVLQENEKRAREQAACINEQERQLEDQRNAFRLRIKGLTNDLTETKINLKQYGDAAAAAAEETEPFLSVLTPDKDLLLIVQKHMNGELDWHGLLDMCMYSADMEVGEKNDRASQIEFHTNRTKLQSTMRILGMKKEITHLEDIRHMVHDVISLLHHFKHVLYVVSYGDR
jgi:hypothetical protein